MRIAHRQWIHKASTCNCKVRTSMIVAACVAIDLRGCKVYQRAGVVEQDPALGLHRVGLFKVLQPRLLWLECKQYCKVLPPTNGFQALAQYKCRWRCAVARCRSVARLHCRTPTSTAAAASDAITAVGQGTVACNRSVGCDVARYRSDRAWLFGPLTIRCASLAHCDPTNESDWFGRYKCRNHGCSPFPVGRSCALRCCCVRCKSSNYLQSGCASRRCCG
jgi:hypothetical protein